ncbi:MAG: CopG family transcriptional regulator [Deltaproteobacteria bacterium]|nr:CopG family transcriptional regulator [Deltaproteobacteria bacterium]
MISIPDGLLEQVDAAARATHRKRSEFFKELALRYLERFRQPQSFSDLEQAATTSFDFWDNPIDDETWNHA